MNHTRSLPRVESGFYFSPRAVMTARQPVTNAIKVNTAFTAWEYSHCLRASSTFAGVTVQFCVNSFMGYVKDQKRVCVTAINATAASESHMADRVFRTSTA